MQVSDVILCYKNKRNPTHRLNYGMNTASMSGALLMTEPPKMFNEWLED